MSFNNLIKAHEKNVASKRKVADAARDELSESIETLTSATLNNVSKISKQIHEMQRKVESQTKELEQSTKKLVVMSQSWVDGLAKLDTALKELGDTANFVAVIESDMTFIAKTLDNIVEVATVPQ